MAGPHIIYSADGVHVVSVQTEGGTRRDRPRAQVRQAITQVLSELLQVPASAISVQSAPGQAPRIVVRASASDERHIGCSFSHEAGLSLAAINLHGAVGVDIMRLADVADWQAVARDYLGPQVSAALLARPAADRPRAFAQAWAVHEARLKCLGQQLTEWRPAASSTPASPFSPDAVTLQLPSGFAGALAYTR